MYKIKELCDMREFIDKSLVAKFFIRILKMFAFSLHCLS